MSEPEPTTSGGDYQYTRRYFEPMRGARSSSDTARLGGDRHDEPGYVYTPEIVLAVNTALAAGRPLLVAGPAGTGKSSLAIDIARHLKDPRPGAGAREVITFQKVVTGRTEGRDLLWEFDAVRRLRDAHAAAAGSGAGGLVDDRLEYRSKGVLWQAFQASGVPQRSVVLIDEIDKADPDVPSSLLDVLGSGHIHCDDTGEDVSVSKDHRFAPLIVITTNDERELSRPFRRRCVTLRLRSPDAARLQEIATARGLTRDAHEADVAGKLAQRIFALRGSGPDNLTPNAAEYLDALRACLELRADVDDPKTWEAIATATLFKPLTPESLGP